jgi:hypothetical protein
MAKQCGGVEVRGQGGTVEKRGWGSQPEQEGGRCMAAAELVSGQTRAHRIWAQIHRWQPWQSNVAGSRCADRAATVEKRGRGGWPEQAGGRCAAGQGGRSEGAVQGSQSKGARQGGWLEEAEHRCAGATALRNGGARVGGRPAGAIRGVRVGLAGRVREMGAERRDSRGRR